MTGNTKHAVLGTFFLSDRAIKGTLRQSDFSGRNVGSGTADPPNMPECGNNAFLPKQFSLRWTIDTKVNQSGVGGGWGEGS